MLNAQDHIDLTVAERASNGARWLDGYLPDWWQRIRTRTLDIGSFDNDILGQLFGSAHHPDFLNETMMGFRAGELQVVDLTDGAEAAQTFTRVESHALTRAWQQEIIDRVNEREGHRDPIAEGPSTAISLIRSETVY